MDRNERLSYLESRHGNETASRIISQVMSDYIAIRMEVTALDQSFIKERVEAVKNSLFLKYTGIEFEGIFQAMYTNRKMV